MGVFVAMMGMSFMSLFSAVYFSGSHLHRRVSGDDHLRYIELFAVARTDTKRASVVAFLLQLLVRIYWVSEVRSRALYWFTFVASYTITKSQERMGTARASLKLCDRQWCLMKGASERWFTKRLFAFTSCYLDDENSFLDEIKFQSFTLGFLGFKVVWNIRWLAIKVLVRRCSTHKHLPRWIQDNHRCRCTQCFWFSTSTSFGVLWPTKLAVVYGVLDFEMFECCWLWKTAKGWSWLCAAGAEMMHCRHEQYARDFP